MNTQILYYGKDEPLPERVPLRAGPLSMVFENGDLRYVRYGSQVILLRVYWAVRDQNWATVTNAMSNLQIDAQADSFRIRYDAECKDAASGIDFTATTTITGDATGKLSVVLEGDANSMFLRNRLGFCVLQPASAAGAECMVTHDNGKRETANLPIYIYAHQPLKPFEEIRSLRQKLSDGVWADFQFEGDIFEMEDQRNWTDASFKTFCTPLRLPYPVEVPQGTHIRQAVQVQIVGNTGKPIKPAKVTAPTRPATPIKFIAGAAAQALPAIGLGQAYGGKVLSKKAVERLRALKLNHLRVDLHLSDAGSVKELQRATKDAEALGVPLEVALFVKAESAETQLQAVRAMFDMIGPKVRQWLVYPAVESQTEAAPIQQLVSTAREQLADYKFGKKAMFASGSDADFIFANKQAQAYAGVAGMDAFSTPSNPQVHAFDNSSLTETLAAEATLVKSAKRLVRNKPVFITPLTFRWRWNAYTSGPSVRGVPVSDARQASLFGADWTLGSIKYLAQAGAASATYFETVGERGVLAADGSAHPMYHVFADVAEFAGGETLTSKSSEPLVVEGLVLRKGRRTRTLLANMTNTPQSVTLSRLGAKVTIKRLDEATAGQAMKSPETWRALSGESVKTDDGKLVVALLPYAVVRVDG